MSQNIFGMIMVLLIGLSSWLWLQLTEVTERLELRQKDFLALEEEIKRITSLQAAINVNQSQASQQLEKPKSEAADTSQARRLVDPVTQLALAQSYKIDRVVDWISLLESKLYFLLFPPSDQDAKERQAIEFQRRTEEIRAGFDAISKQEFRMRSYVR
jgi:hypothetical protein